MAVYYWTYEQFIKRTACGVMYILAYDGVMYLLNGYMIINLSTLEVCYNIFYTGAFGLQKEAKLSNGVYLKDVFEECEFIFENQYYYSYSKKIEAARVYMDLRERKRTNNPYLVNESPYKIEKRKGFMGRYIPYREIEKGGFYHGLNEFKIKYKNKIYQIQYGLVSGGKFGEIYPNKKIEKVSKYEDLFLKCKMDDKTLIEAWDECEFIHDLENYNLTGRFNFHIYWGGRDAWGKQLKENKKELIRLYRIAEDDMIAQGHIPQSSLSFKRIIWLWFKYKAPWVKKRKEKIN